MYTFLRRAGVALIITAVALGFTLMPSHAAGQYFRFVPSPGSYCTASGSGPSAEIIIEVIVGLEWANLPPGAQYERIFDYNGDVFSDVLPIGKVGTGNEGSGLNVTQSGPAVYMLKVTYNTIIDGVPVYSSTLQVNCNGTGPGIASVQNAEIVAPPPPPVGVGPSATPTAFNYFPGPNLPAVRNLVAITSDTPIYSAPNGIATGNALKTCQTAFVIETSADSKWFRLFLMGGWIPASVVADVAEDYGQLGGQPRLGGC